MPTFCPLRGEASLAPTETVQKHLDHAKQLAKQLKSGGGSAIGADPTRAPCRFTPSGWQRSDGVTVS